jgi:pyridoxamine 5'-phosphate oxidase
VVSEDPRARSLDERELAADPLEQFSAWFEDARAAGLELPEAVALATATPDGAPSLRMVLLKGHDQRGLVFFSAYASRKGQELAANPQAALLFYWHPLGRQVRIEGAVERVDASESDEYFGTRPRASRLSAAATRQSEVVAGRDELERRVAELDARHAATDVPRPEWWGGFRLVPEEFEFWQHRQERLHDRFRYRRDADGWLVERLTP